MDDMTNKDNEESDELSKIYKIFKKIYLKAIPELKDLSHNYIQNDYREWVKGKNQIDYNRIDQKFQDKKYSSIIDAIKDIRLVFLNCYTFYGTNSDYTKQSLQFEELFEQEINYLNENIKPLADIQLTLNLLNIEENSNFKFRYPKDCYDSILLRRVAHCRPERLKENHKKLSTTLIYDDDNIYALEELKSWENEIFFNENYQCISSMWELPEIGNFMAIIFKAYDIDIIKQGEIERMFLMPKESTTLSKIMTALLMPIKRREDIEQVMPYSIWSKELSKNVSDWYKVYHIKNKKKVNVMSSLGIHPNFWTVVGDKNPLIEYDYCKLSYSMKVWLIKGLCDNITIKDKTISDIITNCNERQCTIWKNDMGTEEYFFFNLMPDLRIYYYNIPYYEQSLEFLETENVNNEEMSVNEDLSINGIPSTLHSKSRVKPSQKHFKLIADSVQDLRSFLEKLVIEDKSVPENLINSLESFIMKIEQDECNLINLNNNSKIKLFRDWKSYSERIDKDIIALRGKKEQKSISQGLCQGINMEKRKRKIVVREGFESEITFDSDEYFTETDGEDYTDSEDEWGAINQPKSKYKQPIKAHSKILILEKEIKKRSNILKPRKGSTPDCDTNNKLFVINKKKNELNYGKQKPNKKKNTVHKMNTFVNYCSEKYNCSTISDSKKNETKRENILNDTFKMNTVVNGYNEKSICSDTISSKEKNTENILSRNQEVISTISEGEKNKNASVKQKYIIGRHKLRKEQPDLTPPARPDEGLCQEINMEKRKRKIVVREGFESEITFDSDEYFTETDGEDYTDSEDEWGAINQPKSKYKQPIKAHSKILILEKEIKKRSNILKPRKGSTPDCDTNNKLFVINKKKNELNYGKQKQNNKKNTVHKMNTFVNYCSEKYNCSTISDSKKNETKRENILNDTFKMNTLVNGYNEKSICLDTISFEENQTENILSRNQEVISTISEEGKNKNASVKQKYIIESHKLRKEQPDLKRMKFDEIVTVDDNELDNCKIIELHSSGKIVNNKNEQNHCTKTVQMDSVIPGIQNTSVTPRTQKTVVIPSTENSFITSRIQNVPVKINRSYCLNNSFDISQNSTSGNKQIAITNFTEKEVKTTSIPKLSPEVSIMPANVHLPKSIEVTMIKTPPLSTSSHFTSIKRSTIKSNDFLLNNPSVLNVRCNIISESKHNGEVTFYVILPNGKKHKLSDELMNQYLKEHNNILPDYWLVPLTIEVAKGCMDFTKM